MNKPTTILAREHDVILRMLKNLSMARDRLEKNQRPPARFFQIAMSFADEFADDYHHYKEEYLMFGLLADKKDGLLDMEIGSLRYQHERCRTCVNEIKNALEGYDEGDGIATTTLLEHLAAYISLLRCHIYMEDRVFFPMFNKLIDEEEQAMLVDQFELAEKKGNGRSGSVKNGLQMVEEMGLIMDAWAS